MNHICASDDYGCVHKVLDDCDAAVVLDIPTYE